MDMDDISLRMVIIMKDSGRIINIMVMENLFHMMVILLRVYFLMLTSFSEKLQFMTK